MSEQTNDVPHVCIDRWLPEELAPATTRGAAVKGKLWKPGRVLRVHFMDGEKVVQDKVAALAHEWSKHANIRFNFVNDMRAEIRISFKQSGSWSYIGTDALKISWFRPTMNYGWLKPNTADSEYERVVIHEFGHALGMIHEHQNPVTSIPWDKEAVYAYYGGPPNNWSRETTDTNLFQTYSASITNFTEFDRDSIMLYPIQQQFTIGEFEVGWNRKLSPQDIKFIGLLYPFAKPRENELTIGGEPLATSISKAGEIDEFTFVVTDGGQYTVETGGRTDLVMTLYGPDDNTVHIAEDDDSGRRLNPRITQMLLPGTYTALVRHFSAERTGDYTVSVRAA